MPVLGGTFAAVPGTPLLEGEGWEDEACFFFFNVSVWLGVINILKDRTPSPHSGLK